MLTKITENFWLDLSIIRRICETMDGYEMQLDFQHMTHTYFVEKEIALAIFKALEEIDFKLSY